MEKAAISLMLAHRSVRRFQPDPVPEDILNRLIECGCRASNTGNMQLYSVVATTKQPLLGQLAELHFGQGSTAPLMLTVCADVNRYHHWCRLNGCDEPYDNLLWLLSATVDASICAQNICVAAAAEGLGFCYLGTVLYNTRAIASLLQLPRGVVPVVALCMGYPAEQPAQSERLPIDAILHRDTYHEYSDDDIRRLHRLREEFPFNREMVRQNGVANLAELFTRIRYPKRDNVAISQALSEFIEQAGFMNF
ncbi:MAG: Nitroreductase [bacterium P3]|nr:MAG: Nitroreductase [bacterium P3]KWW42370.1 MAG: Nitroreductase [bacterium F083]